ncbi:MAG TPA: hypothetical protein VG318_14060 [Actinomycetota bacterium]|nr:hypothetical protein [Actinomycetota bacterium]
MRTLRCLALSSIASAVALSSFAPAAAHTDVSPVPPAPREWTADEARLLYWAERAGLSEDVADRLQGLVAGPDEFVVNLPWGDLTGDGLADVLALGYEDGPGGLGGAEGRTHVTALSGLSGRTLWSRSFDEGFAFPIDLTLGRRGRSGVLMVSFRYPAPTVAFIGIDSRGRDVYRHEFAPTNSADAGVVSGREEVVSFDLLDALPGRATELLIGVADVRQVPQAHESLPDLVARTRSLLVDGRNGNLDVHQYTEVGVGRVPIPLAAPDLDGDGFDDQVVTYVVPDLEYDEETGLPIVPDATMEHVRGRRGSDGVKLWTSPPLDIASEWESPNLVVTRLGDYKRDGSEELLLSLDPYGYRSSSIRWTGGPPDPHGLWLLSGKDGNLHWYARGHSPTLLGDLDVDGRGDLVTAVDVSGRRKSGTWLVARSGLDGASLYRRFFRLNAKGVEVVESFLGGVGDLHPDGAQEVILQQALRREFDGGMEWALFHPRLVSGRTGTKIPRSGHVYPIHASIDGRGDDLETFPGGDSLAEAHFVDGSTRRLRLSVGFDIPLTLPTDMDYLLAIAAPLNRDACADFVGTLSNETSTFAVMIDGGSGRVLWSRRQLGLELGGPIVQTLRVDRNRAC